MESFQPAAGHREDIWLGDQNVIHKRTSEAEIRFYERVQTDESLKELKQLMPPFLGVVDGRVL